MSIGEMTRKELEALPLRKDWQESVVCQSVIIIPGRARDLHDSGYRCMDAIAVRDGEPVCRLAGGSDVIHLDGIGGSKYCSRPDGPLRDRVIPGYWSIDCLRKSGLLQLFPQTREILCGSSLSSFEVWALTREGG